MSVSEIAIDRENPQWHNYFLCGVKGVQVRQRENTVNAFL